MYPLQLVCATYDVPEVGAIDEPGDSRVRLVDPPRRPPGEAASQLAVRTAVSCEPASNRELVDDDPNRTEPRRDRGSRRQYPQQRAHPGGQPALRLIAEAVEKVVKARRMRLLTQ